jgi:type 1 glutamine amidotransferase
MTGNRNVLLIGDDTDAPWHPLAPARQELERILGAEFNLESTENYSRMARLSRSEVDLFICYTDCWSRDLTPEQTAGVLAYAAAGGGILIIHNGISVQRSYELSQLIGARFTGHPPYQTLSYHPAGESHPIMEGIGSFTMDEEPYMFEFDPFTKKTVFLEFEFEQQRYPAAWAQAYGLGRVVYLQPGHHALSFHNETYNELIRKAARWAAARPGRS